ncbi:MAG TPA: alkaline phosphatase family protein [Actinomycetota bacterium]|nr:alkaline phosphatase family protein [Actinomycetota bacterium]
MRPEARRRRRTRALPILVVVLVLIGGGTFVLTRSDGETQATPEPTAEPLKTGDGEPVADLPKKAYLRDACRIPAKWVKRIHRGWAPGGIRDYDLVIVPKPPNYMGTFVNTSHSAPYDFLQKVPLIFYGKGFVEPVGRVTLEREPTIADLAPTYAHMMGFDEFPDRTAETITEVLKDTSERPKLIVTAVIDGGGWNALEEWPDAWPFMKQLVEEGANVEETIVGSSPSITPATHTNLSTGTFPRYHGVTAIAVRADDGSIVGSFSEVPGNPGPAVMDARVTMTKTTLADLWDRANGNEPLIGMLAAGNLQLGMIGHGSALEGGDKDIAAILSRGVWATNPEFYSLPEYVNTEVPGPEEFVDAVDRADGQADGKWKGHGVEPLDGSPAFAPWENATMFEIMEREGFGADELTDLFYVNYKAPDKAGHTWNMIAPEQEDVIRSVDEAIEELVGWLDDNVGEEEYVLVVTADHGQTPLGGWAISRSEIGDDLGREFDGIANEKGVIGRTSASSFFSNPDEMEANGVTPEQVSSFLSRYTIGDNIPEGAEVPEGFEDRLDERIFDAVFPGRKLPKIVECTNALAEG